MREKESLRRNKRESGRDMVQTLYSRLFFIIFHIKQRKINVSLTRVEMEEHALKWMMGSSAHVQQSTKGRHVKVSSTIQAELRTIFDISLKF